MVYDYNYFVKEIYKLTQIDLSSYKQNQMKRRIDSLIQRRKVVGYNNYIDLLKTDRACFNEFVEYITINVSEFYRNPDQWEILSDKIMPELLEKKGKNLKIWSAACSTGDEPYSLVMALSKYLPLSGIRIIATDISDEIIDKAKLGIYNKKSVEGVPDDYLRKYFSKNGEYYSINEDVKRCVQFKKHNLLKDPFITGCDLIVCRNVLIYFTEEAKDKIFYKFYDALSTGGILFIGSTEQILNYKEIGFERKERFFYSK